MTNTQFLLLLSAFHYLAVIFTAVNAHNVTEILNEFGDFSQFNDALSQTQIAAEINRRKTITVLAVDNGGASQLSSQSTEMEKKILSIHVILDYYDAKKFQSMNKTVIVTTLFQSSGQASRQLGFLNVTRSGSGQVMFGSASPGSNQVASLVKTVYTQPFNISVLQVSSIISPSGLSYTTSTMATPPQSSSHAPPPSNETDNSPPSPTPVVEAPESDAPVSADGPAPAADSPGAGTSSATSTRLGKLGVSVLVWCACHLTML